MQVHGLVTFSVCADFSEARSTSFDLDLAAGLLLNMFDVRATLAYNLGSQVEPWDRLQVNWNALFWPFSLHIQYQPCPSSISRSSNGTYTTKFVPFHFRLPATEPALVHEIG
jgi:hypothetical protein